MQPIFAKVVPVLSRFLLLLVLVLANPLAWAQPAPDGTSDLPVPARLSVVEGKALFWRPGDQDWSPAQVNLALAAGDTIFAGDGGTVEIQVGPRAFVRLMANTELTITRQDSSLLQLRLASGDASLDLRGLPQSQLVQIETPNAAFGLDGNGYYRVDFRDDATRFVVRRNGRATLTLRDGYSRPVGTGEQIILRGVTEIAAEVAAAPTPDNWDRWSDSRTDYYDKAASNRYLPPDVYGVADLDQYGTWRHVPDYGTVWMPTVAPGWAPYSAGSWRWDPVYEWTWVDQAPWGWAPSHYGRWVSVHGRWGWVPGPRVTRSVYMPAVVAFVGFGGSPKVGWVALGWGEPIVPWWGHQHTRGRPSWGGWGGPRVVNNVVIQHNTTVNINTINYRNSRVPQAVTAVHQEEFGRGHEHRDHDHDHNFHFAKPEDGKMMPIHGALPFKRDHAAATAAPPGTPVTATMPARGNGHETAPAQRAPGPNAPAAVMTPPEHQTHPQGHHEARFPEPAPAATAPPQTAPRTLINNAPAQEAPPRVPEQHHAGERHEGPPMPGSPRMGVPLPPQTAPRTVINNAPAQEAPPHAPEQHHTGEHHEGPPMPGSPRVGVPLPPQTAPRTVINNAPVHEPPHVFEQHRADERHEAPPMPGSPRAEVPPAQRHEAAPPPQRHEAAPPPQHAVTIQRAPPPAAVAAPPPAREAHPPEPPHKVEPSQPKHEQHRHKPDDQPEGQHPNSR